MNIIESAGFYEGILNTPNHSHSCCEIVYLKKGEISLDINGKKYKVKENTVYIASPMEKHSVQCLSKEYERFILFLNLPNYEANFTVPSLSIVLKNRPVDYYHLFEHVGPEVEDIFRRCIIEFEEHKHCLYTKHKMTNLILDLLVSLYRHFPLQFLSSRKNDRLLDIQKYMDDNFYQRMKISDIAQHFNMNSFYFSHSFKNFSGYSPKQYLTKIRFTHVRQMLVSTDLTVTQIAEGTGFETTNDLSRKFKQEFGITPTDFRKGKTLLPDYL